MLVRVGITMLLEIDVRYVPTTISLAVVTTITGTSIWLSLRATRGQGRRALPVPAAPGVDQPAHAGKTTGTPEARAVGTAQMKGTTTATVSTARPSERWR
ncbi:hypothetical protein [Blastococcus sp. SYSU DS1024]